MYTLPKNKVLWDRLMDRWQLVKGTINTRYCPLHEFTFTLEEPCYECWEICELED